MKIERNTLCPCGSGKKHKKCCMTLERKPSLSFSTYSEVYDACDAAVDKMEAGDILGAELEAERLYELYPNHHMVNFLQGICNIQRENYQEAISFFEQVLNLNPNHVQSYGNMALAHSALGEQKLALQYLDKALLLDPTYELAQQNRKNIMQLKEGEKSLFMMQKVSYYKEKFESEVGRKPKPQINFTRI